METKPSKFALSLLFLLLLTPSSTLAVQILSKSKLQKCEKTSDSPELNCTTKILLDMAVPSGSSGGEASIVAEVVEVEEDGAAQRMQTVRVPPVVTVNKSQAYALYELTYIRDVPYKPEEYNVKTRKCEPDAGANVVGICERLRDEKGHIIEHTQPTCCPCGTNRRVPSSCGNIFDKVMKGKANTAHCLRFPGDWFHVFGIGKRSLGFTIRIEVKTESKISEVIVGPENRTVSSGDNFLRVNLIGDFVGYTSIPSLEDFYLVIPRQGGPGQPQNLGNNFSMWMLLERVRFTLDGLECNKIGVSYEAYNGQPNFCSSPLWSCLYNQLWNFWEADQNRIKRHQMPLYGVQGRYERINQHPNAGTLTFSIGITEVLNSNLLIELSADDIEYVFQRSPGKILSVTIPTFEALTQFGTATITTKNIGELEASYSLTFDCSKGVALMEEQFFIMKPAEVAVRSFKLYLTTDQASKYLCSAILKDSDFNEVDRAECQFTTTATMLDNGSQITPFQPPKGGVSSILGFIQSLWRKLEESFIDFFTGRTCRNKCSGFFDFHCHIQYMCLSWMLLFGLFLAIFPTVMVLVWLLHQKGLFDPIYEWWEDQVEVGTQRHADPKRIIEVGRSHSHPHKHHRHERRHHKEQNKRISSHYGHQKHNRHGQPEQESAYDRHTYDSHLHRVYKDRHKHKRRRNLGVVLHDYSEKDVPDFKEKGDSALEDYFEHRRHRKGKGHV